MPLLRVLLPALVAAALLLPSTAAAAPYLPPAGKAWHGVASGDEVGDFAARSGRAPAVWQHWIQWGRSFEYAIQRAERSRTRLMLHLSTSAGQNLPGVISPGAIARGAGDGYLVALTRRLSAYGRPVYLRPFGEMNNCDLPYSSHDCDGSRRGADHSAAAFRRAWRRVVAVVRGGDAADVAARLAALGQPALRADAAALGTPQVAFVWSPMTGGSPMIRALRPQAFWPGGAWVDWVGTSFYSRFPNFRWLTPYYEAFAVRHRKPFALAEWAVWGADDARFVRRLYAWIDAHRRTRMAVYNQGSLADGPFALRRHPVAAAAMRRATRSALWDAAAPEHR